MIIRTETKADFEAVYHVNYTAFGNRDDEAKLVEAIRQSEGFISELSLVAECNNEICGHLLLSKAYIVEGNVKHAVIALAPIAVSPKSQKSGVGSSLINEGLKRCRDLGFPLVLLIGHPEYYSKFGFKPARSFGLELKQFEVPDDVFMVYELREGALQQINGELQYPDTFF